MRIKALLIGLGLVLGGCSGGGDQETAGETEDRDSMVQPMVDAMDDAKAVEDQVMEHKQDIDDAVEDAEESVEDAAEDPPTRD
jgi:hypothetical protein